MAHTMPMLRMSRLPKQAVLLGLLALGGCDSLTSIFEEKEVPLPGQRQAVFTDIGSGHAAAVQGEGVVSIPPARLNTEWSQPGGDAANAPGNLALGGGQGWRIAAGALGDSAPRSAAPPIVYGGRIYRYGDDGAVTAYTLGGGRGWSASAKSDDNKDPDAPGGGIAAGDGRIVAVTGFGTAAAFSAENGGRAWLVTLPEPARGAPTISGGKVYFVSARNNVYALNLSDGSTVWTYDGVPETAGLVSSASPAVSGGIVVVPSSSGELLALDAATGGVKWQGTLARAARYSAIAGLSAVAGRPVIADGTVYAAGVSGRMIAIKLTGGLPIWDKQIASAFTPAISGNAVFVVTLANELMALDRSTGKVIWSLRLPSEKDEDWAGPTLAGGNLWIGSNKGRLIAVAAANGQIGAQRSIGEAIYVPPIVAQGSLLVMSGRGSITAAQ